METKVMDPTRRGVTCRALRPGAYRQALKGAIYRAPATVLAAVLACGLALAQDLDTGVEQYRALNFVEAEKTLRQVCEREPENASAHEYLGLSLAELKRADEAEAEINKAAELGLAEDRVKVGLARVAIERRDVEGAGRLLEEAHAANPENADAYHYRGMVRTKLRNFGEAVTDFDKALELNPASAYSHYYAGIAYNGLKQRDKMVEHFQTFVQMAPNAPEAGKLQSLLRAFR